MRETSTGHMVRLQRELRGMSTTALATQAGCTSRHIELIEQGRRTPSLPLLREIAKVLGVRTAVLLGEPPRDSHERGRPQIRDIERAIFSYRSLPFDAEPPDIEQLAERVATARSTWLTSPNKYTILMRALPALIIDAEQLLSQADGHPDERRAAAQVAAEAYTVARGVLKSLGRTDLQHMAADRAMRYAEETEDPLLIAWSQRNLSASMLTDDMHEVAEEVALRSIEIFSPYVPDGDERHRSILGSLHLMAALSVARRGDYAHARELVRGPARTLALTVRDESNHFGLAFGPTNVMIHMTSVEHEAREPAAAIRVADEIDVRKVPSIERRTTHLGQVARACEDLGDDAASLVYLMRIERECPEELDHTPLLRDMIHALAQRARPSWAPEVRYLAERHRIAV
ncbi:helix-turn-helix domain-containing protein [Nonomuraea cavernae]|uniref:Transcriptional regulator n=1 Tax=Nonomuraea cavernae TaxID=2045107 RepID=A0A917YZW7_9ACTN|nr:helix-turn-helix transcriptional regulator [Nonomuraea cavernae]MCA2186456.1 helix-turn-helix domain-containing protein [Nonomuraea cavernae]GGO71137.1 transcriptional regulator [Nonomuraea cavernae]